MKKQKEPSLFAYIFANNVFYLIISPLKKNETPLHKSTLYKTLSKKIYYLSLNNCLGRITQLLTLRVAQFFFHDNASPAGMRDRSKVKKTVPAQVPLETKHFEKKTTTQSYSRNALAFAELIMR